MTLTASLVGSRGVTGGNSVTTTAGTSSSSATFACLVSYDQGAGTITAAGDNKGNTYTAIGTPQADGIGGLLRWYVCEGGVGGAGHTFTFTTSNACYAVAHLIQITGTTGTAVRDKNVQGQDTAGQPWDAVATGTLGFSNEVILAACAGQGGAANYTSTNTTILSSEGDTSSYWTSGVGWTTQAGTASFTPSFGKVDAGGGTVAGLSHLTFRESASSSGTASGATLTATVSLIAGTATGVRNGTAAGATFTATVSLIAGTATGVRNGTAAGATFTATSTIIAGSASGSTSGTAAGTTLTTTVSLIPGAAAGIRNATAAGATLPASASIIPGTAYGSPQLGAYTYVGQEEGSGTNPATTSAIATGATGSSFITLRAGYTDNNTKPTDSKANRWMPMGGAQYQPYGGTFDAQVFIASRGAGGSGHTVSFSKPGHPTGEITIPLIEVIGGRLVDFSLVNIGTGNTLLSGSVTVGGPALLVAFWLGDAAGLNHTAAPNNGFSNFISFGTLPPNSAVQMFVASRQVSAAGTYNVTWTETPDQGAILVLAAFSDSGPNGYAPGDTISASVSLLPGGATGTAAGSGTAAGATLSATTQVIPGVAAGGAVAAGAVVSTTAQIIAAGASGGAVAAGATMTASVALVAGSATGTSGSATAPGAVLSPTVSIIPGIAFVYVPSDQTVELSVPASPRALSAPAVPRTFTIPRA